MDNIYLFFVIALFILAISDLVVGVGNDAVNFLNSAVGSRVAPMRIILFIAALGILAGTTFSSGMMEIARSGVFYPDKFYFNEIMVIFLAVMITDIILLDTFNTFGLPTSTTVSIVFELLGAAVAVSLYKIHFAGADVQELGHYINSGRALTIISGILISVVIAFTFGVLVQFLSRLLFTFNYEKKLKYFGAVWGSIAITSIVYFMLVKGARGASFMTADTVKWVNENTLIILGSCFVGFALVSQVLISVFRINILKVVVLIGTFSIAMAFAANDLVNFIGVPLAGYDSFLHFVSDPSIDPSSYTMESLLKPVKTPTVFLLAAGLIMIASLVFSRKARSVTKTEVELARQGEGSERFSSSLFAQALVRKTLSASRTVDRILPTSISRFIEKRFEPATITTVKNPLKKAHFDLLRASVNMFVASILIALATSFKLPLSTTYVTFMVAMGTSLADKAWGRESAVYRITGVMTVIGGWFFTAFTAFTGALVFGFFIRWAGLAGAIGALLLAFFFLVRTHFIHKKRTEEENANEDKIKRAVTADGLVTDCRNNLTETLDNIALLHNELLVNFVEENWAPLKKAVKRTRQWNEHTKSLRKDAFLTLRKFSDDTIDSGHHYVDILDHIREAVNCLCFIAEPFKEHLDNAHSAVIPEQHSELMKLNGEISLFYKDVLKMIREGNFSQKSLLMIRYESLIDQIERIKKQQIKLIKAEKIGTKNSLVIINYLTESRNILLQTINMLKSYQEFFIRK
jgi:phosphate/sulfate permease